MVYDYLRFSYCDFSLNVQRKIWARKKGISYFMDNFDNYDLNDKQKRKVEGSLKLDLDRLIDYFDKEKVTIITYESPLYPMELKEIYFPPLILYAKGNIELLKMDKFAIVGSRKATQNGKNLAKDFAHELSMHGEVIVSGMAAGIDSFAHRGAIDNRMTIAVMATGIDMCYPSYNRKLKDIIEKDDLVITEYFPGTKPDAFRFPIRNRIISGISWGVLVVEAGIKSGTMITVKYAIEQGKEVYAIPGDIYKINSTGTNYLIKNAMAKMVTDITDILPIEEENKNKALLSKDENNVLNIILEGTMEFDDIMEKSQMDFGQLTSILFQLEVKGFIIKISTNIYRGAVNG